MKLIETNKAEGTKVTGSYEGMFPFTGTVSAFRFGPRGVKIYGITLDSAIEVFGQIRNEIEIWSSELAAQNVMVCE